MLLVNAVKKMMEEMELDPTPLRVAFLKKYECLLCLRGFADVDPRSIQSAIQVLLNFSRKPDSQLRYYRAVNRNLDRLIEKALKKDAYSLRDRTDELWDCPGHVGQVNWHLSVEPDLHSAVEVSSDSDDADDAASTSAVVDSEAAGIHQPSPQHPGHDI